MSQGVFETDGRMQFRMEALPQSATPRVGPASVASTLARLIVIGDGVSKADLARATGFARTTVDHGVEALIAMGVVRLDGVRAQSGRGRPGHLLRAAPHHCIILVIDVGGTHTSLSIVDMSQRLLAHEEAHLVAQPDAEAFLRQVSERLMDMIGALGLAHLPRRLVFATPGVIDHVRGRVQHYEPFGLWEHYPVRDRLAELVGAEVALENDVTLRALGEARSEPTTVGPLLYLKIGAGVGLAQVDASGDLRRGADDAAGQLAHVRVGDSDERCYCGGFGCLGVVASTVAIARRAGLDVADSEWPQHLLEMLARDDSAAVGAVRGAAELVGQVVVELIRFVAPERIVIGGALSTASDHLLAAVRSVVYRHAPPSATRHLTISRPTASRYSAVVGGVALALDGLLSPESFERPLSAGSMTERGRPS